MAYEDAINAYRKELLSFTNSRGAAFISITTDKPVESVLFKELLKVGIIE